MMSNPAAAVNAISLKLPQTCGLHKSRHSSPLRESEWRRPTYIVASLSPDTATEVRDLILAPPTDNDFDLQVELVDFADAGIAFRGYDAENIWLFVLRSEHNDAFFCRVHRGAPQEITAIMPLRELSYGREALRLGGLVGRLVLLSGLVLLALRFLLIALAQSSWAAREWYTMTSRPPSSLAPHQCTSCIAPHSSSCIRHTASRPTLRSAPHGSN